jgi:hypothetical protein
MEAILPMPWNDLDGSSSLSEWVAEAAGELERNRNQMRVTTTIFMLDIPGQVETRRAAFMLECLREARGESETEYRSFASLYSGQNRIDRLDSSINED